jgi:hypothetical protein
MEEGAMRIKQLIAGLVASALGLALAVPAHANDDEMEAALAQLEAALPGELLTNPYTTKWSTEGNRVKGKIVQADGAPSGAAFEVSVRERYPEVWQARVTVPVEKDIAKGDDIEVAIWLRADSPMKSLDTGQLDLQIVRTKEPYDNVFSENIRPTGEWQLLTARGIASADFDADETVFGMNIGYGRQTLQFSTVYMLRHSTAAEREAAQPETE